MTKQFEIRVREDSIKTYLIETESEDHYHKGDYQVIEKIDEDCINEIFLEIEEI